MKFNFKKFNILNIVFLSAIFCFLNFSITFAQTGFFEDDFEFASFRNIYLGDECRAEQLIENRSGNNWDIYYQNISCLDKDYHPWCENKIAADVNMVIDDKFPCSWWQAVPEVGQVGGAHPEPFRPEEGFDSDRVNAKVEIADGKLKMEREFKTLIGGDGTTDYNDRLGHRYMVVKSTEELVSSETFKLDMSVRLSEPTGWGIGWYVGNIVDAWYPNVAENTCINFAGVGSFCGLPGQDEQWHRIEVWSQGDFKDVCVDRDVNNICAWTRFGVFPTTFTQGYIWMGNRVHQCGGWTASSVCSTGVGGPGPWPVLEMSHISLKRGPMNESVIPNLGCGGGINSNETFTTTYYDDDGDFKNVQMLINSTADIQAIGDVEGFFWGKLQKKLDGSFEFCIMENDVSGDVGNWLCESDLAVGQDLGNFYGILDPLVSNYSFDANGTTLTVNWDIEFLSAWEEEYNNIWLYVIDDSDLEDAFEDLGDYNIDNKAPDIPIKILPDSCTNDDTPILEVDTSADTGCANNIIQYQFELDTNNDLVADFTRIWGDDFWITHSLVDGIYNWRVRAKDENYNTSDWSNWWSFNIPCNVSPIAIISCEVNNNPVNPGECFVYAGGSAYDILTLKNNSIDCDSSNCLAGCGSDETFSCNDEIVSSKWEVLGTSEGDDCVLCNYTPPVSLRGTYTAKLTVEDSSLSDDEFYNFTIKQDATSDFVCSLDNVNFVNCNTLSDILIGQTIYLKDNCDDSPDYCSKPSDGAGIIRREWRLNGSLFVPLNSNFEDAQIRLGSDLNEIELTVFDSAVPNRSASEDYTIGATLPLPDWKEVPPR